jgi:hypothetical protein
MCGGRGVVIASPEVFFCVRAGRTPISEWRIPMKKTGTLSFLAASLFAANLALANPVPPPATGGTSGNTSASATPDAGNNPSSDSGCSLAGSHLARSLAPWLIAGAFSVSYFFVRRRSRR